MPVHKEYPEGYKWIELKTPQIASELPPTHEIEPFESKGALGQLYRVLNKETGMRGEGFKTPERATQEFLKADAEEKLADALKYEGDTMGHCVGGYCPDVVAGRSRIYSLRDPRGEPHVTVEVQPMRGSELGRYAADLPEGEDVAAMKNPPQRIVQIKGKQNAAPKEQYLPYVQDFVRGGQWSDVGDIYNAGLFDVKQYVNPTTYKKYLEQGLQVPRYATEEEIDKLHNEYLRLAEPHNYKPPQEGMKKGGKVSVSDNLDTMMMDMGDKHMAGGGVARKGIKALKLMLDPEVSTPSARSATKFTEPTPHMSVIKEKGGNWLTGDVEPKVGKMKMADTVPPEQIRAMEKSIEALEKKGDFDPFLESELATIKRNNAINNWIDRNLANYIKKEMATPEDPVRKLAEEGITHKSDLNDFRTDAGTRVMRKREQAGFPAEGMGQSNLAKQWESLADFAFGTRPAKDVSAIRYPWVSKLDPETPVYGGYHSHGNEMLGFDHIVDVLRQDVREGRIRPEQLSKVSMEQAVRRTYEYDQEMARKMAEAQIKATEGMPIHKEYPEGYKWIELALPNKLPEGHIERNGVIYDQEGNIVEQSGSILDPRYKKLEEALKYEGQTMGHCVGGYCPDVAAGSSRIFSLRDAKGEPHVTIEVNPKGKLYADEWMKTLSPQERSEILSSAGSVLEHPKYLEAKSKVPQAIKQIKGKQNKAPKAEYLPYVQDFVRSGEWSDIGDFKNTGFDYPATGPSGIFHPDQMKVLENAGIKVPKYLTVDEANKYKDDLYRIETGKDPDTGLPLNPEVGMKKGGKVQVSDDCNCQHMEMMDHYMSGGGALSKAAIEALERMKALKPEFQARANLYNKYKAETASIPYNEVKPFQMTNEQIREEMERMAREQAEREQNKSKGGLAKNAIKLVRAPAKSKAEIETIAERMAPQMTGEFVRGEKGTQSVAGKTQKQFAREKELKHDIRGDMPAPGTMDYEKLKDQVVIGIAGDPTITGKSIHAVGEHQLDSPSPQHGGPLYGLGRDDAHFWASQLGEIGRAHV